MAHCVPTEATTLETKELEFQDKKLVIEMKSNEQGKFVKILEVLFCAHVVIDTHSL